MIQHGGLVHGAGVVIQATGDGQVHLKVLLGHAEGGQIAGHGGQLVQALVKQGVTAAVALQGLEDLFIAAVDGDKAHDLTGLVGGQADLLGHEQLLHLGRADLVQLVHGAHDGPGLVGQVQHGIEAVQNFAVVHPDLEALQAHGGKGAIDDGGDLRVVGDVQLAVADDVDISLIELAEAAALGPLAAIDLADLEAAEGEGQLVAVLGHILGQGDGQVKAQRQVGVALLKAIDLLLRLAAALGQQHLAGLDDGGVQGGEAVQGIGLPEDGHHAVKLDLAGGHQFHKTGQGPGLNLTHKSKILSVMKLCFGVFPWGRGPGITIILPWGEGGACDTGRIPGGHGEVFGAGTSKTTPFRTG